jgi:deoxycytidine triphosphate deaminase
MVDTARTEQPKAETEHDTSLGAQTISVSKEPHSEASPNVPVQPPQRTDDKQRFKADNYSGVLVKDEIRDKKLIQVPDPEREESQCYQPASYDLRLGAQYAVPNDEGDLEISNCEITGRLTIPAFGTAIVSTYETVALPDNVVGRFNLRVQHALEGLIVQMGTQVEPHYEGPLFALLHNVSDSPKTLKFRDFDTRPFTIEFSYTSRPASNPDPRKKRRKSFSDFIPTNSARGGLNLALARMHQLQSETKKLSQDLNARKILWFTGGFLLIIVLAATVLIPIALTKFSYDRDYFPLVSADAIAAMKYGPN